MCKICSIDSWCFPVVGLLEESNECSSFITDGEFFDQLIVFVSTEINNIFSSGTFLQASAELQITLNCALHNLSCKH
jgi:hypothetical protein